MYQKYTAWEKLSAFCIAFATFYKPFAKILFWGSTLMMLAVGLFLVAGCSWSRIASYLIIILIFAVPVTFAAGIVWISIEDDYRKILQSRYRKW